MSQIDIESEHEEMKCEDACAATPTESRPKNPYNSLQVVLDKFHSGVEFVAEDRKVKLTPEEKLEYAAGNTPATYLHHDERLNQARVEYYSKYYAFRAAEKAFDESHPEHKLAMEQERAERKAKQELKKAGVVAKKGKKVVRSDDEEEPSSVHLARSRDKQKRFRQICLEFAEDVEDLLF